MGNEINDQGALGGARSRAENAGEPELFGPDEDEQALHGSRPFNRMPSSVDRRTRKGVPNKRTVQMRDIYLKMGLPHPLLAMGQVLALGVDGLAAALQCDKLEAFGEWRKVAERVLEYLESKMPMAVKVDAQGLPVLVFGDIRQAAEDLRATRAEGALAIDDDLIDVMEKQTLSVIHRAASDRLASDGMQQVADSKR
jgi:hypothetical protein